MKKALFATSLLAAATAAMADIAVPEVSDVTIRQSAETRRVTVTYTLANAPAIVIVDICTNGVSIGDANLHYFTGDCNKVVQPGANKRVSWQSDLSWPGHEIVGNDVTAKVYAWALDNPPDYMVADLTAQNAVNYYTSTNALPDGGLTNDVYRTDRIVMRRIHAAGVTFTMGAEELATTDPEYPREVAHQAQIDHDYYMSVFELTGGQYKGAYGSYRNSAWVYVNGSMFPDGEVRSMINLTYNVLRGESAHYPNAPTASSVLGKLRSKTGAAFDLPGDAEWEYACRAGTTSGYWNDGSAELELQSYKTYGTTADALRWTSDENLSNLARYTKNYGMNITSSGVYRWDWSIGASNATARAGTYAPNAWGLYDMHGNAMEICLDFYKEDITGDNGAINTTPNEDNTHVARGGSYKTGPISCRSASRQPRVANYSEKELRDQDNGCRLVVRIGGEG